MDMEIDEGDGRPKRPAPANSVLQRSKWQLLDSILPNGGFAHSCSLEAAIQTCVVSKPEDLQDFIIHALKNAGSFLLPFVYTSTASPDARTFYKLERTLDAMLTNKVWQKASISQGSVLMRVVASLFMEIPSLKAMRDEFLSDGSVCFHHAPTFGLVCGILGINSTTSQRAFLLITLRDNISSATTLNVVRSLGATVLQHRISEITEAILQRWLNRGVDEACQTVPLQLQRNAWKPQHLTSSDEINLRKKKAIDHITSTATNSTTSKSSNNPILMKPP